MFNDKNILSFMGSEVAKFIESGKLPQSKAQAEEINTVSSTDINVAEKLPNNAGGRIASGGGSSISSPKFGATTGGSFSISNFMSSKKKSGEKSDKDIEKELEEKIREIQAREAAKNQQPEEDTEDADAYFGEMRQRIRKELAEEDEDKLEEKKEDKPEHGGTQLVEVTYGHKDNDKKRYVYYATNKRTGDAVTPMVNHWRSGKLYKTLAIVRSTRKVDNASEKIGEVTGLGISIKTIGPTSQKSLPGYYRGWGKDA